MGTTEIESHKAASATDYAYTPITSLKEKPNMQRFLTSLQKDSKRDFGRSHSAPELLLVLQTQGARTWHCNSVTDQQP